MKTFIRVKGNIGYGLEDCLAQLDVFIKNISKDIDNNTWKVEIYFVRTDGKTTLKSFVSDELLYSLKEALSYVDENEDDVDWDIIEAKEYEEACRSVSEREKEVGSDVDETEYD